MIHIAYIVNEFAMGGLERCVARLVNGLDRQQFQPLVIALTTSSSAEQWIERDDVPVIALNKDSTGRWSFYRRFAERLRRERVDVVHSHNWATLLETALARRMANVPIHVHAQRGMFFHGNEDPHWKRWLRRQATRWAVGRADCLVTVADSVREYWLKSFGTSTTPLSVLTNGVDVPAHDPTGAAAGRLRQSLGTSPEEFVIGSVGRLVPVKAFGDLIEAVALVRSKGGRVRLVIVGAGPQRDRLSAQAVSQGVSEYVHLVGEQVDVGDWLKGMQLYVNCSLSEGMSQSVLEAMAIGLPMVVTDAGENRVLVGGPEGCGVVVPCGNPPLLAAAIDEFVRSPERGEEMGRRALQRHAARFSVGRMIEEYEELYAGLMTGQLRSVRRHAESAGQLESVSQV